MTTVAIVEPTNLVGRELRETLDRDRKAGWDLRLLSHDEEAIGTLTEAQGAAAMVQRADAEALAGVELAFFCGDVATARGLLAARPDLLGVLVTGDAAAQDGPPLVAGVNLEGRDLPRVVVSPPPTVVALAHLLHPLRDLGLVEAVATVLQPVSAREQAGLEEVLDQTRAILAFSGQPEPTVFGRQLAFNVLPATNPVADPVPQLQAVLGRELPISVHRLQGGMFHSFAVSLHVRLDGAPGVDAVRKALGRSATIELVEEPETLGPIDAAGRDEVLVGHVEADPHRPGAFWIWSVMDNLTRGGAVNALALARALLGTA